ncbi:MAG: adenylate/guanylate cyclase domain-containing protein [Syntrophus sp. (in: bacteria)]|nr:adenylate/guanylate cyclase domain-containing protein [Syntrophus sp. (in: bacteria)]
MIQRLKKWGAISPLKITLFIIFLALFLFFADVAFLRFMELKALDLRMVSRGKLASGGETVIVAVDEKSLSELGRWPWPRTVMARLLDQLKAHGAKVVGFDVIFSEPDENAGIKTIAELSREIERMGLADARLKKLLDKKRGAADTDTELARSIERAKNVTLGYFFHISEKEVGHLTPEQIHAGAADIANSRYQMIQAAKKTDEGMFVRAYSAVTNIRALIDAAENSGYFNAFPDSDGVIRWAPLVIKFQEDYYSSLPISMLLQYLEWPMLSLKIADFGVESVSLNDLVIPTDESGRLLINFMGPARTFPHYSIADILNGRLSPDLFKDKIVLVGATATGIYDMRVTPLSAVYPGVEIHANVIDNILHQNFLIHSGWTKFIDICLIILLGFIVGLAIPRASAAWGVLLILVLLAVFIGANAYVFSRYNIWLNLIYPVLTIMTIYLAITVYRYITEEREKKKIRGAFQYYLTASVINEMLKDPTKLKLGGDKKDLSVLFSDIRGFTTISEKLTPEELVHLLNEYLTAMTDIVFKYDGLLDKYMGDAIMAVYGAPLDQPDHRLRACRTALDMLDALKELQKKWSDEGRPVLNIGVGVNSGDMVVGNMGSQMRFDYTVMGDSVNLGSRLEGINKEYGTNIIISEYTYAGVKDVLTCRELDSVRVKGKKLPVKIYELLCEKKDAEPHGAFLRCFEAGLEKYKQARWDEAISVFRQALEIRPADPPSELYIKRCEDLKKDPPPLPWDGVFTMTKK